MQILNEKFEVVLFDPADHKPLFELVENNRARLSIFLAGIVSRTGTLEDTREFCRDVEQRMKDKSYFPFVVRDRQTGKYAGLVDIKNIDWQIPKAEVGYCIDKDYEGQGITRKAVASVIDYMVAEFNLKKVFCRVSPDNPASIGIALSNGFELEGTLRREYKTLHNDIVDLNYYGRLFD